MLNSLEMIAAVNFCANTANLMQILGYVLLVFKIVIPILLIVFGILDLGKAVVAAKPEEVKKALTALAYRALGAVVVFFIPTIVGAVLGMVSNFKSSGAKADYDVCRICITNPGDSECQSMAEDAWNGNVKDPELD